MLHRTLTPQPRAIRPQDKPEPPAWLVDSLSTGEAAQYWMVTPQTVRDWIAAGRVHAYRVGPRHFKIPRSELDRLLTEVEVA